jgi:hypothetical protein
MAESATLLPPFSSGHNIKAFIRSPVCYVIIFTFKGKLLSNLPKWKGMIFLDKEKLYHYIYTMIESSTKKPKYMSISTVKAASLLGFTEGEVEKSLNDFVSEGRLKKAKLEEPPFHDIYLLP